MKAPGKGSLGATAAAKTGGAYRATSPASRTRSSSAGNDVDRLLDTDVVTPNDLGDVPSRSEVSNSPWERAEGKRSRHRKTDSSASSSSASLHSHSSNSHISISTAPVPGPQVASDRRLLGKEPVKASASDAGKPISTAAGLELRSTNVESIPEVAVSLVRKNTGRRSKPAEEESSLQTPSSLPTSMPSIATPGTKAATAVVETAGHSNPSPILQSKGTSVRSESPEDCLKPADPSPAATLDSSSTLPDVGTSKSILTPPSTPPSKPPSIPSSPNPARGKHAAEVDAEKKRSGVPKSKGMSPADGAQSGAAPAHGNELSPNKRTSSNQTYVRPPRFSPNTKASLTAGLIAEKSILNKGNVLDAARTATPIVPKKIVRPPPGLNVKPSSDAHVVNTTQGLPTPSTPTVIVASPTAKESRSAASTPPPSPVSSATSPVQSTRSGSSLSLTSGDGRFSPALPSVLSLPSETSFAFAGDPLVSAVAKPMPYRSFSDETVSVAKASSSVGDGSWSSQGTAFDKEKSVGRGGVSEGQGPPPTKTTNEVRNWYSPFDGGLSLMPQMSNIGSSTGVQATPPIRAAVPARINTGEDLWSLPSGFNSRPQDYISSSQVDVWGSSLGLRTPGKVRNNPYERNDPGVMSPWSPSSPMAVSEHLLGQDFLAGLDLPETRQPALRRPMSLEDFQYQIAGPAPVGPPLGSKTLPRSMDSVFGGGDLHYRASAMTAAVEAANAPSVGSEDTIYWPAEHRRS